MTKQLCLSPHQPVVARGSPIRQGLMENSPELFIFIVVIGSAVMSIYLKVSDVDKYYTLLYGS